MNFNYGQKPEYKLFSGMIYELITLYGIAIKFIKTTKINDDKFIFKDFSHLDSDTAFVVHALPENAEGFDSDGFKMSDFGMSNFDNINIFVHAAEIEKYCTFKDLLNNIIVLPSNKVFEITYAENSVPGIDNLYTQPNDRAVYKLTCVPYSFKSTDEINKFNYNDENSEPDIMYEYDALDNYFEELLKNDEKRLEHIEVEPVRTVTVNKTETDSMGLPEQEQIKKPQVSEIDDVWGKFE